MPKRIDISNQKFGKLTALSYNAETRKWRCRCNCGSPIKEVAYRHLKSGATQSCGCSKSVGPRKIDLTGRKFGRLTVVEENGRARKKRVIWRCKCDCGNEVDVLSAELTAGDTRSCGCIRRESRVTNLRIGYDDKRVNGVMVSLFDAKLRTDNKSGYKGVSYVKKSGKWLAQLRVNGVYYRRGPFVDKMDAVKARKELEELYLEPLKGD